MQRKGVRKSTKRRKISIKYALKKIRANRPGSPSDFRRIGLPVRYLNTGLFRAVCKIINCDLVVKFPRQVDLSLGRSHSAAELQRVKRLKSSRVLQPALPEIPYFDKVSGILVMRYYPRYTSHEEQADAMGAFIQRLIFAHTRIRTSDLHSENVHKRRVNNDGAVLIDLGY